MAFSVEHIPAGDMKRFAICYLFSDRSGVNWEAASNAFNPDAKVDSFKTVTGKATKKALEAVTSQAPAGEDGDEAPKPTKAKGKTGGKRKKADTEGDGEATPKPKKSRSKKKDKSEERIHNSDNEDGFIGVKDESED